jgi:hypothetical protein
MLKKLAFLFSLILLTALSVFSYCNNEIKGTEAVITPSSIRTYINGYPIDSWIIGQDAYVDVLTLEKYGYDVLKLPNSKYYSVRFDDHIRKENEIRTLISQNISTNGIEEMWYGTWIESIYPKTDSFNYMHGAYVYDYSYAEESAAITFSRDIPIEEINTENIRIYGNGFDLTDYFSYDYSENVNRLTIRPIDDVIFKYVNDNHPFFNIEIRGSLKDVDGQQLINSLNHGFYMEHRGIQTSHVDGQPIPYLEDGHEDYIYGDTILKRAETLGHARWDEEKRQLEIDGQVKPSYGNALREILVNHYSDIISHVLVADRNEQQNKGYGFIKESDPQQLAVLASPLEEAFEGKNFIQLKPNYGNKDYIPEIIDNVIKAPEDIPANFYDLVLLKGLTLQNGSVLEENIYFNIYIGEK